MGIEDFERSAYNRQQSGVKSSYEPSEIDDSDINKDKMQGFFIGFVVGEGSFYVTLNPDTLKAVPIFSIKLHEEDMEVLKHIHQTIGLGDVRGPNSEGHVRFDVRSVTDCITIAEWVEINASGTVFKDTSKYDSFKIWCECLSILAEGRHRTEEGFIELAKLRDQMNRDSRGRTAEEIKSIIEE